MQEYSSRCDPVWSEREIEHKLTQAETTQTHQKPRGHLLSKSVRHVYRDTPHFAPSNETAKKDTAKSSPKTKRYEPRVDADLPSPILDGARELLRAAFQPGEGVAIVIGRIDEKDNREIPKDEGIVLSREEWLLKLDKADGNPNGILSNTAKNGLYIRINPMRLGGKSDADVTDFRHALIECDSISQIEQWRHIAGSNVPVTAVISSGGRSVHAWVRVDAKDRREYDERVKLLHAHFTSNGFEIDGVNKNPSRFSRLPNCVRGKSRQELLALRIGTESFGAWHSDLESESTGRTFSIKELLKFKPDEDPNCLLGERWICKGGSCVIVGQSGLGKSSIAIQAAVTWALGKSFFGIPSKRPLKSLFIQAENDEGDLAEMVQGVINGLGLKPDSAEVEQIERNVVIVSDSSHTGEEFTQNVQRRIDRHRPDLVWFDPLLSFIGDDISKQSVCSQFLRTWLAPISDSSGVAWMMMHHTGKPSNDPKARQSWNKSDHSYAGIGSSELTNWARAVCLLERVDDDNFSLRLAKRGKRAGAMDLQGVKTERIWLQHAPAGIQWLQVAEPPPKPSKHRVAKGEKTERDDKHKAPGQPSKIDAIREHMPDFYQLWKDGETLTLSKAAERLLHFASGHDVEMSKRTAMEAIKQLGEEAKLTVSERQDGGFEVAL